MFVIRWPLAMLRHMATSRRWRIAVLTTAAAALALRARTVTSAAPNRLRSFVQELGADFRVMFGGSRPAPEPAGQAPMAPPAQTVSPAAEPAPTAAAAPVFGGAAPTEFTDGAAAPAVSDPGAQIADSASNLAGDQPATTVGTPAETIPAGEDQTGTFRPTRAEPDAFGVIVTDDAPAGLQAGDWVKGDGSPDCPADHPIKGNANSRIYHMPGEPSYERTIPELCFATEEDAAAAGYRPRAKQAS